MSDLAPLPLLPESSVPASVLPTTNQALESSGDLLQVRRIRDVMKAVTAQRTGRQPALVVLGFGDRFEMVGVDAFTDPAQMINLQTLRDRSSAMNPERPVGNGGAVFSSTQDSISIPVDWALPDPAARSVDQVPGPIDDEGFGHVHHSIPGGVS
jgi:hypothetical protein